jgi:squalene/oxidosqualene cyclase-like protein
MNQSMASDMAIDGTEQLDGVSTALGRAWEWIGARQGPNGSWEGEVTWCPIITAQYVIARRILNLSFDDSTRAGIIRYFEVTRVNGVGWGLHRESHPYVFVTTLVYVALRLLGVSPQHPLTQPAREWLLAQPGGVAAIPTWGKFWLALIGLYEYRGMNRIPPELFLLPRWLPAHPDKLYCHTRYIYLGMAYLAGREFRVELPETSELREELYATPYAQVDFAASRNRLSPSDVYVPPTPLLRRVFGLLRWGARLSPAPLARRALAHCASRIEYEQRASRYQGLSPVNGLLNTLAMSDLRHPDLEACVEGLERWRWRDEREGVRFAGARSNAWDTAFTMQALVECAPAGAEYAPAIAHQREFLRHGYDFLRRTQMTEELPDRRGQARDPIRGGWCFSDGQHRWPVSDCTAEALCAVLAAHGWHDLIPANERISDDRLQSAAEFILSRQNPDGGFGTYERRRGGRFLEWISERINPSEMFGQCMTERSYIECTSSAVKALSRYERAFPGRMATAAPLDRARSFLRSRQRADGSYPGFWGINFTYASFFVAEALRESLPDPAGAAGDPVLRRIGEWLIAHQRQDGGWGEHYASCLDGVYREHSQSQAVMTAWAVLALLVIVGPESSTVERGIAWLISRQTGNGTWRREAVNGVFFGSAMLDYELYRAYFPAWALARYAHMLEPMLEPKVERK